MMLWPKQQKLIPLCKPDMNLHSGFFLLLFAFLICCKSDHPPNFSKEEIRIFEFQDHRNSDSLRALNVNTSEELILVAQAMASIQDSLNNPFLFELLNHKDDKVRMNAAFAIGQNAANSSFDALRKILSEEASNEVKNTILEAMGKCASLSTASWFSLKDVERKENFVGLSWGIYRLALKGLADQSHAEFAFKIFEQDPPVNARLGLAHFLARTPKIDLSSYASSLGSLIAAEQDAEVLMALILAARKTPTPEMLETLQSIWINTDDYRVKVNLCRSLSVFKWDESGNILLKALADDHAQVSVAAAESIQNIASIDPAQLKSIASDIKFSRARAIVYQLILKSIMDETIIEAIKKLIEESEDPYEKSFYTDLFLYIPDGVSILKDYIVSAEYNILKTSAAQSYARLDVNGKLPYSKAENLNFYKSALQTLDVAVVDIICGALKNPRLNYKELITELDFLYDIKKQLELPRDNETLQAVESCIAYFEGRETAPVINSFNNPIDWSILQGISKEPIAVVKTSKGEIVMQLYPKEAPGSVANFIKLSKQGYYDDKNFHRVVPNFVAQGGCKRGDGWGSEDYSIRSEFSLRKYKAGSVGMASAGKDTEGTQWFITHSPTPHLDGRYTIFAEVIEGMDVVPLLEIGDKIISVEIK